MSSPLRLTEEELEAACRDAKHLDDGRAVARAIESAVLRKVADWLATENIIGSYADGSCVDLATELLAAAEEKPHGDGKS